jgi:hypothetical protein
MKYIRTEDGVYEFERYYELLDYYWLKGLSEPIGKEEIIEQADTIEELIMPGDLVRYEGLYMSWIEKDRGDQVRGIDMHLISRKDVDDLWIPIGDNPETYPDFKLVASKNDKGELELL